MASVDSEHAIYLCLSVQDSVNNAYFYCEHKLDILKQVFLYLLLRWILNSLGNTVDCVRERERERERGEGREGIASGWACLIIYVLQSSLELWEGLGSYSEGLSVFTYMFVRMSRDDTQFKIHHTKSPGGICRSMPLLTVLTGVLWKWCNSNYSLCKWWITQQPHFDHL